MEEPRRQQGVHDWKIEITGVLDDSGRRNLISDAIDGKLSIAVLVDVNLYYA